jgi:hypothetical protein
MVVSDQLHAPAALHPKAELRIKGWLGPQAMLEKREKKSGHNQTTILQVFSLQPNEK